MLWLSIAIMVLMVMAGIPLFLSIFVAVAIISFTVMDVDPMILIGVMIWIALIHVPPEEMLESVKNSEYTNEQIP